MASGSGGSNGGPPLSGMIKAVIVYLVAMSLMAAATPMFRAKDPALAMWLAGGLILFAAIARIASRRMVDHGPATSVAVSLLVALGVSLVTVFVGFVLMVNIWMRMGLGH